MYFICTLSINNKDQIIGVFSTIEKALELTNCCIIEAINSGVIPGINSAQADIVCVQGIDSYKNLVQERYKHTGTSYSFFKSFKTNDAYDALLNKWRDDDGYFNKNTHLDFCKKPPIPHLENECNNIYNASDDEVYSFLKSYRAMIAAETNATVYPFTKNDAFTHLKKEFGAYLKKRRGV